MKKKVRIADFPPLLLFLILQTFFYCDQPPVTAIQVNEDKYALYGNIEKTVTSFSRVEAVVGGNNSIDTFPKIEELWFNATTNGFSGNIYLSHTNEVYNYTVYVNLYSVNSKFIGRSVTVHFTSNASIIEIPYIDPLNAVPNVFAGNDTILSINDSTRLDPTASDLFGGIIESWEWDVGNTGIFHSVFNGDTMIVLPSTPDSNYTCIVKVTDNDGNSDLDTTRITILKDDPIPTASTTTSNVTINDTIIFQGTATDEYGKIIKWEWDLGNTGSFIETSPDSNCTSIAPSTADTNYQSVLRVTDDDSNVVIDTVGINVVQDIPVPTASTTTPVVSMNDSIKLQGTAKDCGRIVKWEWDAGNTGNFVETTPDSNYSAVVTVAVDSNYQCILRVTDDDNNVALDSVKIRVTIFSSPRIITTEADGVYEVYAIDIDGDTDMDVLSASSGDDKIAWYENNGNQQFTAHIITTSTDRATSVFAIDIDGDTDIDVLSASMADNKVAWYENDGSQQFTAHTITTSAIEASSVFAIDMDGDTDIDVLSASREDDKIAWYENDGTQQFTAHTISTTADEARRVFAIDLDGDTDIDVLSASIIDDKIAWYENNGSQQFTEHIITTSADGARSVYAIDIDGDADIDVLSASFISDKIEWYENDGNQQFTAHLISTTADGARTVYAIDIDGDTDIDVLSASSGDNKIAWYENDGSQQFTPYIITTSTEEAYNVLAIDMDGDTDVDVLSASWQDDKIAWFMNLIK